VYINSGDESGSVTVRTKADTDATEADETFFVDFNSLHTLGRRPGTYSWIPEPVTGIPTSVSARVTISNVVPQTTQTSNPAPCIPWLASRPLAAGLPVPGQPIRTRLAPPGSSASGPGTFRHRCPRSGSLWKGLRKKERVS